MIRRLFPDKDIYVIQYDASEESIKSIVDMCKMSSRNEASYHVTSEEASTYIWIKMSCGDGRMNICINQGDYILIDLDADWNLRFIINTLQEIKEKYGVNIDLKEISLSDFQAAQQTIIDYYGQDFTKIHGDNRPCICCDAKIKTLHPETTRFPQSGMYDGGTVERISSGYGSKHDTDMFIIAICDDCIDRLKKENKVQYAGNYMHLY